MVEKKSDNMKKAAAYIRVSDERQDEYSPDSQLRLIKDFAINNDFDLPEEYIFYDDGISAKGSNINKRKSFNNMIAFAKDKSHPIDAILVWKFSRFARDQEQSIVFKNLLKKNNVDVISISEPVSDDIYGSLIERIIEWMDEFYLIRLSGEVKRGMSEKASRGETMCPAPFGYDNKDKTYIPNADADTVRWIFSSYLNGMGTRKIATTLTLQDVRTKRGNPPDYRFVEYILQNPTYTGKIRWSLDGRASRDRYHKNNENVIVVQGSHQPLVNDATFDAVQEKIAENKLKYGKYQRREQPIQYMLKGLVRCSNCGATLTHVAAKEPAMQCYRYAKGQCTISHHLSVAKANRAIIDELERCINDNSFNIIPVQQSEQCVIDYDALIRKEEEKIKRASDAYDAGFDTLKEYGIKKRAYTTKIEELIRQRNSANVSSDNTPEVRKKAISVVEYLKDPSVSEQAKNEALRSIIHHIVFEKSTKTLKIYFYG